MTTRQLEKHRIIPARAGFTDTWTGSAPAGGDHPRSRGVYEDDVIRPRRRRGIIPARAGFTLTSPVLRLIFRDHPRSRGVYACQSAAVRWSVGSSPLARGLLRGRRGRRDRPGIIPARAGFTSRRSGRRASVEDHPRSRGVYIIPKRYRKLRKGSSPLARGLQAVQPDFHDPPGIIPARAGFTGRPDEHPHREGDHPRSRGVYIAVLILGNTVSGSSPLARGLRRLLGRRPHLGRIIPARAGFTRALCPVLLRAADHPRSRGVYWMEPLTGWLVWGSSPLARGLHLTASQGRVGVRIIPARAGFT